MVAAGIFSAAGVGPGPLRLLFLPRNVAAAGGFLVGIVTFVLVCVLWVGPRGWRLIRCRKSKADRALEIAASRSFLVDVHVVKR